jgi:signal peptidase I
MTSISIDDTAAFAGDPPPTRDNRPRPWLAAVLGVVMPGMGHVYAGRALRGVALAVCAMAVGVLLLRSTLVVDAPALRVLLVFLTLATTLSVAVDAFRVARTAGARRPGVPVLAAWAVGLIVASSLVQPMLVKSIGNAFSIPGSSMMPALLPGERVLFARHPGGPVERGAVVVYVAKASARAAGLPGLPLEPGTQVVARVVGLPGDTLAMRAGRLTVDGRAVAEPYAVRARGRGEDGDAGYFAWQRAHLPAGVDSAAYRPTVSDWGPIVVPAGSYLTLGDNRSEALDGRYTGFVAADEITHRASWIYFSRQPLTGPVRWSRIGRSVR